MFSLVPFQPNIPVHSFTRIFFYEGRIPPCYSQLRNNIGTAILTNPERGGPDAMGHTAGLQVMNDIPPYLEVIPDQTMGLGCLALDKYEGFLADFRGYDSFEAYLQEQLSRNSRSQIRRRIKRLEHCFEIRYRWYYGAIDPLEYEALFVRFRDLIERRFDQRGEVHQALKDWELIRATALGQIRAKSASLFVIFDGDKPIDICLNYHFDNTLNNMIRSFDIDYAKFSIGQIDIYKQMEWCFGNRVAIFDLSRGEMPYKRLWCNREYRMTCHVLYRRDSLKAKSAARMLSLLYRFKEFLKKYQVHRWMGRIRAIFGKRNSDTAQPDPSEYLLQPAQPLPQEKMVPIQAEEVQHARIWEAVYEFQYLHNERSKDLRFFANPGQDEAYLICGKKHRALIVRRPPVTNTQKE